MKVSSGWGVLLGLTMATGACAQAAAAVSAAASAVVHVGVACSPSLSRRVAEQHPQGTSLIRFHVDETGKVTAAEIIGSAGQTSAHRLLDNAAMRALAQCPFTPARDANGQSVASDVDVSYTWKIE